MEFILSQIFVIIGYAFLATTYFAKNRKLILVNNIMAGACIAVSYFCLKAWTGFAMMLVTILRNFVFIVLNKKGDSNKIYLKDWLVLIFFVAISLIFAIVTFDSVFSLFSVLSVVLYTFSIWQKSIKVYRILGVFVELAGMIYFIFIGSWFGVVLEFIVFLIQIYEVINYYRNEKTKVEVISEKENLLNV